MGFQMIYDFECRRFSHVIDVGFVSETENADDRSLHGRFVFIQGVLETFNGVFRHVVVGFDGQFQETVIESGFFGTLDQIMRVYWDTMSTDTAGRVVFHECERLGSGAVDNIFDIDAHLVERAGDFIDESDVDVTERVFKDLHSFGFADILHRSDFSIHDGSIELERHLQSFLLKRADDSRDIRDIPFDIAGIDTFRTVRNENIFADGESMFLKNRAYDFFGNIRIDGGFENDQCAFPGIRGDRFRGTDDRTEIRVMLLIDGSWDADDMDISTGEVLRVACRLEGVF